jgi:hypothetical protein
MFASAPRTIGILRCVAPCGPSPALLGRRWPLLLIRRFPPERAFRLPGSHSDGGARVPFPRVCMGVHPPKVRKRR